MRDDNSAASKAAAPAAPAAPAPALPTTSNDHSHNDATVTPYRDNANKILSRRISVPSPASSSSSSAAAATSLSDRNKDHVEWKKQMMHIVKVFCPSYNDILKENDDKNDNSNYSIAPLSGGLSNELFVVKPTMTTATNNNNNNIPHVLIRIHPSNEEIGDDGSLAIVDRNIENKISAWLSSQKVGPIYYGRFMNGRVEELYMDHIPLTYPFCYNDQLKIRPCHIGTILAQFHTLQVPSNVLPKPTTNTNNDKSNIVIRGDVFRRVPTWIQMAKQLSVAALAKKSPSNNTTDSTAPAAAAAPANELLLQLEQHWIWLDDVLHNNKERNDSNGGDDKSPSPQSVIAAQFFSQIVFCHMDMQPLNLLIDTTGTSTSSDIDSNHSQQQSAAAASSPTSTSTIKVIDFEYSGWNARGIDFANTFCEHCDMNNLNANYEKEYPTIDIQNEIISSYLQYMLDHQHRQQTNANAHTCVVPKEYINDPLFLQSARYEISRYTLVSHLGWAIWSIVQYYVSDIDFDYIQYSKHRLDGFYYMKQQSFS